MDAFPGMSERQNICGSESSFSLIKEPSDAQTSQILNHYAAGQLGQAELLATALTEQFPDHHFGWKVLGVILKVTGRPLEALDYLRKAVSMMPGDVEALNNLGIGQKELGFLDQAEASFSAAIALQPTYAEAHVNLGATLTELNRFSDAESAFRRSLVLQPAHAYAHNNLGIVLHGTGRLAAAEEAYLRAIESKPDYAEAHNNLANTLKDLGRLDEAKIRYLEAIALKPEYSVAHSNLCAVLKGLGDLVGSESSGRTAIRLRPDLAEAHSNLGATLRELGKLKEAEASCRNALALNADDAGAQLNFGIVLQELGKFEDAVTCFQRAIALRPDCFEAHNNLLMLEGSMLFNPSRYARYSRDFSQMVQQKVAQPYTSWKTDRNTGAIRIGFVSGDLSSHPVGYFLEGLLTGLRGSSFVLIAYPTATRTDQTTDRLRLLFDAWHPVSGLNDEQAAKQIHSDRIDILFDLSGHTADNRLPVFAWKPAPIQVSWLGYYASTGLKEMDYVLGDPVVTPAQEDHRFVEKVWRLPETYLCFAPPSVALPVAALPAISNGFVTFGCFNKLARMTDEVISVRSEILKLVPGSKLFLKDSQLECEWSRSQVLSKFEAHGISSDRLILEGREGRDQYLACYNRVDLALSPFPYGGGTTSVEGIWMGVPPLVKAGNHFLSRLGETIAHNLSMSDWVASDNEDYILKAVSFASRLAGLSQLRQKLRDRLLASPLTDSRRFAAHFLDAVQEMRGSTLSEERANLPTEA